MTPLTGTDLEVIGPLQLVGVFVLAVLALLSFDAGGHLLFFDLGSAEVQVGVRPPERILRLPRIERESRQWA